VRGGRGRQDACCWRPGGRGRGGGQWPPAGGRVRAACVLRCGAEGWDGRLSAVSIQGCSAITPRTQQRGATRTHAGRPQLLGGCDGGGVREGGEGRQASHDGGEPHGEVQLRARHGGRPAQHGVVHLRVCGTRHAARHAEGEVADRGRGLGAGVLQWEAPARLWQRRARGDPHHAAGLAATREQRPAC
jgi:hypothetical protein